MVLQAVQGIICGTDGPHIKFVHERTGRISFQYFVAAVVDIICMFRRQRFPDSEYPLKLQVAPVINGIAHKFRHYTCKCPELFPVRRIAGDFILGNPSGPHHPPFIVVPAQPDPGDIFKFPVLCNFPGTDMAVIINNGQFFCSAMVEFFRSGS